MVFGFMRTAIARSRARGSIPDNARFQRIRIIRRRIRHPIATAVAVGIAGVWVTERLLVYGALRRKDRTLTIPLGFPEPLPPQPYTFGELGMTIVRDGQKNGLGMYTKEKEWIKFWEEGLIKIIRNNPPLMAQLGPTPKVKQSLLTFMPVEPRPKYKQRILFCKVEPPPDKDGTTGKQVSTLTIGITDRVLNHMQYEKTGQITSPASFLNAYRQFIIPMSSDVWDTIINGPPEPHEDDEDPPMTRLEAIEDIVQDHLHRFFQETALKRRRRENGPLVRDTRGEFTFRGWMLVEGAERDIWFEVRGQFNPKVSNLGPWRMDSWQRVSILKTPARQEPQWANKTIKYQRFPAIGRAEVITNKPSELPPQEPLTQEQEKIEEARKPIGEQEVKIHPRRPLSPEQAKIEELKKRVEESRKDVALYLKTMEEQRVKQQDTARKVATESQRDTKSELQDSSVAKGSPDEDRKGPDAHSEETPSAGSAGKTSSTPSTSGSVPKPPSSRPSGPSSS